MKNIDSNISHGRGIMAISPIMVFLLSYLVVSIVVGDFYKMPLSVALVISSIWAVIVTRGYSLGRRIEIFSKEAGSGNVMYMVWIFVLAGISPIAPFQYLVYPWALMIMVVVSILLSRSCKSCGAFL